MSQNVINTRFQLRNDTEVNWINASPSPVLLQGEIAISTDKNKLKIGDGVKTWAELEYANLTPTEISTLITSTIDSSRPLATVYEKTKAVDGETVVTDDSLLNTIGEPNAGDLCVITSTVTTGGETVTVNRAAYIYINEAWVACTGEVSADKVILSDDITLAGDYTSVGNLTKTKTGTATFATKGKSVEAALTEIFSKRLQPADPTQPAVTISGTKSSENLEVGTTVTKSGTMTSSLSAGSYTYGPATGVTAKTWETKVSYNGGDNIATGTSSSTDYSYTFTLGESAVKVDFYAKATYDAGAIAKDNLGSPSNPEKKIEAGSKTKSSTATYTPFRNFFYGVDNETTTIDSDKIRSLTKGGAASAKTLPTIAASSVSGACRVIVAIPNSSSINVKEVTMPSAMNADATTSFVKQNDTIEVAGADGVNYKTAYKVWVYQPASLDSTETYSIKLG